MNNVVEQLTRKQQEFINVIEANVKGLTAVSVGVCPGCEQCRSEYGTKVTCRFCKGTGYTRVRPWGVVDCPCCDGEGKRLPTMEEFEQQWGNGAVYSEPSFSWSGCDLCGSDLGGDFEPWHAIDAGGEIIHGNHACQDCICYLANGDLPKL
jgi:hypothetical protein